MGSLKPGATLIYERVNGITYAREHGSLERIEIGRDYHRTEYDKQLGEEILWKDILREAKDNPVLQDALEKCKVIYYLSKENGI
jgi:hypothetical protein